MLVRDLVTWTAFSAFPEVMRCWACQILVGESFEGRPPTALGRRECCLEWSLDMADGLTPVLLAMASPELPESSKERMVFCWVREKDLTVMVVRNQEVWELFWTQTYYLHVYICLYQKVMTIILWFDWDPSHQFKSEKTFPWYCCFILIISLPAVAQITWPRGQSCSQEYALCITPPKLSGIPTL